METIEERAKATATSIIEMCALQQFGKDGDGATHAIEHALRVQRDIDIDNACEWLITNAKQPSQIVEEFRKAMKE